MITNTTLAVSTIDTANVPPGKYLVTATAQFQPSLATFSGNQGVRVSYGALFKEAFVSAASGNPAFCLASVQVEVTLTGAGNLVMAVMRDNGTNHMTVQGPRSSFSLVRIG